MATGTGSITVVKLSSNRWRVGFVGLDYDREEVKAVLAAQPWVTEVLTGSDPTVLTILLGRNGRVRKETEIVDLLQPPVHDSDTIGAPDEAAISIDDPRAQVKDIWAHSGRLTRPQVFVNGALSFAERAAIAREYWRDGFRGDIVFIDPQTES
jgi:hypothetical protein